jgi:hypothetical protein
MAVSIISCGGGESRKVAGRAMLSREDRDNLRVRTVLEPGTHTPSVLVCCSTPSCCPMCAGTCPCCDDAEYVREKREASKYVYIRENSIEWNNPNIAMSNGSCCGVDPCLFIVKDEVHVVYFDDLMFASISDKTRMCNECRTCLCGGKGERVSIDQTCCLGLCFRSSFPCLPGVPVCCPTQLTPCAWRHELHVRDAAKALYEIKAAIKAALKSDLYTDMKISQAPVARI